MGARPGLLYRQHGGNVLGAHRGPRAAWGRLRLLADGTYAGWVRANLDALLALPDGVEDRHRRAAGILRHDPDRPRALRLSGARRETAAGRALLRLAARMGRA